MQVKRRQRAEKDTMIEDSGSTRSSRSVSPAEDDTLVPANAHTAERQPARPPTIVALIVACLMGLVFGFAINKGRVFMPELIVKQLLMEKFIMVKMFLSAVATALLCIAFGEVISTEFKKRAEAARENFKTGRGAVAIGVGGCILGVGMALCGACPGTVFVQAGAGVKWSFLVLLGGCVAVLVYSLVEPFMRKNVFPLLRPEWPFLSDLLGAPFVMMAVPFAFLLIIVVAVLEVIWPYKDELHHPGQAGNGGWVFSYVAWPPYVSGFFVGVLQVPCILFLLDTLGSASSYKTWMANLLYLVARPITRKSRFLMGAKDGIGNFWQATYVLFVVLGGFLAAISSDTLGDADGPGPVMSFLGGFFVLIGPFLAAGCTSGHGISGMGLMYALSFVGVPMMFAGGIATAFILRAAGAYDFL